MNSKYKITSSPRIVILLIFFGFPMIFRSYGQNHTDGVLHRAYADNSVLAQGTWYKFSVNANGIYRITSDNLKALGIDITTLNPYNIRIYGNGGGMLPEANSAYRIDDLREIPIQVAGEGDGKFDAGDYILFYGESPDKWSYDTTNHIFRHSKNSYSNVTCYFLNTDTGPGKRIGTEPSTTESTTNYVNTFNDFQFYEKDGINLLKSGRTWYDIDYFDVTTTRDYSFYFPNFDMIIPVTLVVDAAARSTTGNSYFSVAGNSSTVFNITIPGVTTVFLTQYANEVAKTGTFTSGSSSIDIKLTYNKPDITAVGYLNFVELNVIRNLIMSGSQMSFRSATTSVKGTVSEFQLQTGTQTVTIWDVTDPGNTNVVATTQSGSTTTFRLANDTLHEFIAFDGSAYLSPVMIGKIDNQNLHGAGIYDYVIVTHSKFMNEAQELADFHRQHDNLSVLVTTPDIIYNQFSSGVQDVTAIRDFMKMMYDKAGTGQDPKYLLLFGDASYDYKDRVPNNSNLVPSYESYESLNPVGTFVTDDYFVLLNDGEGQGASGLLDAGVGRFPVQTVAQAQNAVDKIEHYCSNSDTVKNDWRNVVCFVADDKDDSNTNIHMQMAEQVRKHYRFKLP